MNFIAIDFETANEKRNSPCSIGIAIVNDGKVIEKIHYLIRPKDMRFMPINIGIHGIRPCMVESEPEFDQIWEKIKHYFNDSIVIAHNASFDLSVLRKTAELYDIELPFIQYICTMKLAKKYYTELEDAKLNTVNQFLGYEFKHHDALDDALACSNIMINICAELKCNNISEVSNLLGVSIGYVDNSGYKPSTAIDKIIVTSSKKARLIDDEHQKDYNYNAFNNEVVVFTGRLNSMSRDKAMRLVRNLGGETGSSVTKKTTMIVSNMKDIKGLSISEMSNKFRKATEMSKSGKKISFLNEEEFIQYQYRLSNTSDDYVLLQKPTEQNNLIDITKFSY